MQSALFDPPEDPPRPALAQRLKVRPCPPDPALQALAAALPRRIYVGTSSWTYPGWAGLVWDQAYAEPLLSKHGLAAYSQHPLMRTVSLDRTFYRPLSASQYAAYAAQVPDDFRFVVKAPSIVTDAMVRAEAGRALQPNPQFLNPELAVQEFVQPALEGLQHKIGALVFQLSPLTPLLLGQLPQVLERLRLMLSALPALHPLAPDGVIAVEVREALAHAHGVPLEPQPHPWGLWLRRRPCALQPLRHHSGRRLRHPSGPGPRGPGYRPGGPAGLHHHQQQGRGLRALVGGRTGAGVGGHGQRVKHSAQEKSHLAVAFGCRAIRPDQFSAVFLPSL